MYGNLALGLHSWRGLDSAPFMEFASATSELPVDIVVPDCGSTAPGVAALKMVSIDGCMHGTRGDTVSVLPRSGNRFFMKLFRSLVRNQCGKHGRHRERARLKHWSIR